MTIGAPEKSDVGEYQIKVQAILEEVETTEEVTFLVTITGCTPNDFSVGEIDAIEMMFADPSVTFTLPEISQEPCEAFYTMTK